MESPRWSPLPLPPSPRKAEACAHPHPYKRLGPQPGLQWERELPVQETTGLGQGLGPALCTALSRLAWNQELKLPGWRDTPAQGLPTWTKLPSELAQWPHLAP